MNLKVTYKHSDGSADLRTIKGMIGKLSIDPDLLGGRVLTNLPTGKGKLISALDIIAIAIPTDGSVLIEAE